ncbi:MAG: DUF3784 domain-containing protein [Syntrophomonas sp.]
MIERWIIIGLSAIIVIFGALIKFGKSYNLIPGYNAGTPEEQKYMVRKNMDRFVGRQLILIGLAPVLGVLLRLLGVAWGIEIGFGLLLLLVINLASEIGRFTPSDSQINKKHSRLYWGAAGLLVLVFAVVGIYMYKSAGEPFVSVLPDSIAIEDAYGTQFAYNDINTLELRSVLPAIGSRANGIEVGTVMKGHFNVEGLGRSQLFIRKPGSAIVITFISGREPILINFNNSGQTRSFFAYLQARTNKQ